MHPRSHAGVVDEPPGRAWRVNCSRSGIERSRLEAQALDSTESKLVELDALLDDRPIETAPVRPLQGLHLHLSIGQSF